MGGGQWAVGSGQWAVGGGPCRSRHFAGHGFAGHGFARHGFARHGFAGHGFAHHGFARHVFAGHGFARHLPVPNFPVHEAVTRTATRDCSVLPLPPGPASSVFIGAIRGSFVTGRELDQIRDPADLVWRRQVADAAVQVQPKLMVECLPMWNVCRFLCTIMMEVTDHDIPGFR